MAELGIKIDAGAGLIRLSGDIDIQVTPALIDAGVAAVAALDSPNAVITIDMTRVTFMDSQGLGALIAIRNAAMQDGKVVTLRGVPQRVAEIKTITGLEKAFDLAGDSAGEAMIELEPGRWLG